MPVTTEMAAPSKWPPPFSAIYGSKVGTCAKRNAEGDNGSNGNNKYMTPPLWARSNYHVRKIKFPARHLQLNLERRHVTIIAADNRAGRYWWSAIERDARRRVIVEHCKQNLISASTELINCPN